MVKFSVEGGAVHRTVPNDIWYNRDGCIKETRKGSSELTNNPEHIALVEKVFNYLQNCNSKFKLKTEYKINSINRRADIICETSEFSLAIECQRSPITHFDCLERTRDYLSANYDVLWIMPSITQNNNPCYEMLNSIKDNIYSRDLATIENIGEAFLIVKSKQLDNTFDEIWIKHPGKTIEQEILYKELFEPIQLTETKPSYHQHKSGIGIVKVTQSPSFQEVKPIIEVKPTEPIQIIEVKPRESWVQPTPHQKIIVKNFSSKDEYLKFAETTTEFNKCVYAVDDITHACKAFCVR